MLYVNLKMSYYYCNYFLREKSPYTLPYGLYWTATFAILHYDTNPASQPIAEARWSMFTYFDSLIKQGFFIRLGGSPLPRQGPDRGYMSWMEGKEIHLEE